MVKALIVGVAALMLTGTTARADVQLSINNGQVSIVAKDATVRQILTEWARVGQTKIVNVERIPGGPITLELKNVSEEQALEVLLRSVSGYMAAPRATEVATLSRFDRIVVMATSVAPRAAAAAAPPPTFQQPQFAQPQQPADDDNDEAPAPNVAIPNQNRAPVFNAFPQPQVVNPNGGATAAPNGIPPQGAPGVTSTIVPRAIGAPSAPGGPAGGVAVPGTVAAPPQLPQGWQPGQPTTPPPTFQPGQPVRRPGGD